MDGPNGRIIKEVQDNLDNPFPGIRNFQPDPEDFRHFQFELQGPIRSLYEGGIFKLQMFLPQNYPFKQPKITFKTHIYNPYIDPEKGLICLQYVHTHGWSPAKTIKFVFGEIIKLLIYPDEHGHYNLAAAEHWRKNKGDAQQKAREDTLKYAKQPS